MESVYGVQVFYFTFTHFHLVSCTNLGKSFLRTLRDRKKDEYISLEQGGTIVASFEAKFHDLSLYSMQLVTTKEERICLFEFIRGLTSELQVLFVLMNPTRRSFNEVTNYLNKVEGVR